MKKRIAVAAVVAMCAAIPSFAAERFVSYGGIYPHLAMFNDEGECGTGAVVPWAGDLWVITYGPHQPVGSSDKLYRIRPDLTRETFPGSVGGTPANRLIHRETNQLLIGPYVIDAKGNVRVVPPAKMPGRLTGAARHLTDPANKVYVATMETGLYELDMRSLAVNTLVRENGMNDKSIAAYLKSAGLPWPDGWASAPRTRVPGYHSKGLASGFGRVFVSNNGENSKEARRNPFVPSGVLAWWNEPGKDWTTIRRCQFTEVTTPDGIYGNEHPGSNPVWAMGWDAKSVILGVTTNGADWAYYRLPKASHAYDGAHGWNTEWPRIRDVGFGDGTLLATMHGTFWRFPRGFSPANPNGIRPISTYLKVIGDFCRWGDWIVFGCDDQAKLEFLGKRGLKKDAPRCERSQSNLWFVKPDELSKFGPPSGEGYVWLNEDVKAGDVSDPFLYAGYESMRFSFTRADGTSVRHELLHDGDWVRVKCLENATGAMARFSYGPAPCKTPELDAAKPYISVKDDNGKAWRFPNVNGDTNVVCREIATERDLLYVGGVWYEVPAENAGGFAALRPIALADAPVKSLRGERGLMYLNEKPMPIDGLWSNGTAPAAYWLWRNTGAAAVAPFKMPDVPVWRVPSREFPITDYGAVTGAVKNTAAFAKAIAACSAAGGGRVVVPKGDWRTGAIHLKSNVALDLREGSRIVFTDDPADYLPAVHTNWEGVEAMSYSPLIYAYCCTNVAIIGKGRIAPETNLWRKEWDSRNTPMHKAFIATLYDWCSMGIPLEKRDITRFPGSHARPHLIQFNRSANILLEDFLIRGSPFWNIHLFHSENVVVRGIDIYSHGHNTDGIDIDMTKNVIVENCIFDQGDDAIVLKAARNHDAWRLGRSTENVVVRNCTVRNGHVLLGIGSDVSGGIRNVFMHDCRMVGQVHNVFYVKTNERRGGFVENIYMKDCSVELRGKSVPMSVVGIETDVLYEWRNLPTWDVRVTRIRNICAENVRASKARHLLMVYGDARDPVDGVTLKNVTCGETTGERLVVVNAKNVTMDGVPLPSRPGKAPAR